MPSPPRGPHTIAPPTGWLVARPRPSWTTAWNATSGPRHDRGQGRRASGSRGSQLGRGEAAQRGHPQHREQRPYRRRPDGHRDEHVSGPRDRDQGLLSSRSRCSQLGRSETAQRGRSQRREVAERSRTCTSAAWSAPRCACRGAAFERTARRASAPFCAMSRPYMYERVVTAEKLECWCRACRCYASGQNTIAGGIDKLATDHSDTNGRDDDMQSDAGVGGAAEPYDGPHKADRVPEPSMMGSRIATPVRTVDSDRPVIGRTVDRYLHNLREVNVTFRHQVWHTDGEWALVREAASPRCSDG